MEAPEADDFGRYRAMMRVQWVLRVLDFFAISMVIPTMAPFLESAGGNAQDYYQVLMATTLLQIVSNLAVGITVDLTGRVKALYVPMCSLSIIGAGLYAVADAVPAWRTPTCIMLARMLSGAGFGKTTLVFVVLARVAKQDADRNRWLVAFSTARSLGLFAGPALAVLLARLGGGAEDHGGSLFGTFALPGVFLFVTNLAGMVWLLAVWHPLPAPALSRQLSLGSVASGRSERFGDAPQQGLGRFFRRRHVLVVSLNCCLGTGTAQALEYVIPVIAGQALLWGPGGSGATLMACSVCVLASQLVVMRLQSMEDAAGRPRVDDRFLLMLGSTGLASTLMLTTALWAALIGRGPGAIAAARSGGALLVMAPLVLAEAWFPYLGNGSNMTFTRLVLTYVPSRMGVCQAIVNTNGPVLGSAVLTWWLSLTYSGRWIEAEGAPQTAILGVALCNAFISVALFASYADLAPRARDRELKSPATVVRKMSSFSDCVLPLEEVREDSEEASALAAAAAALEAFEASEAFGASASEAAARPLLAPRARDGQ